jgi:hypothetical protein
MEGSRETVRLRVLSLGAGVQSTTLALLAAHGEIEIPDCAIFADTQWEPRAVYEHLAWLRSNNVLPFPVHVVTRGNIRESIRTRRMLKGGRFAAIPWHIINEDGSAGMGRRQCSSEYKLEPIAYKIRELLGKGQRDRISARSVEVMIGISRDEAYRMKPSRQAYMVNRYPLVERGMRRYDCLLWLKRHGYPEPPKSACIGCPFTDNERWRERKQVAAEWADAVLADRELRQGDARGMRGLEFMHRSRLPLDQVDFSVDDRQLDLFGNECEGMCGL